MINPDGSQTYPATIANRTHLFMGDLSHEELIDFKWLSRNATTGAVGLGEASTAIIRSFNQKASYLAAVPGYNQLVLALAEKKGLDAVWDDHDFAINDMGSEFPGKYEIKKRFMKVQQRSQ